MAIKVFRGVLASLVLITGPAGTALSTIPTGEQISSPEAGLFRMIKNSSTVVETKTAWNYDRQEFYSQQELDNYILQNNQIETIQTSSNPGKIVNDYQYRTLNPEKIYDINFNNYQLIYRDAYGNVSLTKAAALETYTKNIQNKYSYDAVNWFDSPTEAKIGLIYQGGLQKSLYYYVNGRYYNAFNLADQKALKNILTEGYLLEPSAFTGHLSMYGTRDSLRNVVTNNFRTVWTNPSSANQQLNYTNFLRNKDGTDHFLSPGNDNLIKVTEKNGQQKIIQAGETIVITDPE